MSAASEEVTSSCLPEHVWKQLVDLEKLHHAIQQNHERVLRSLDEAVKSDRRQLYTVWNQYRAVVADLSRVTEDIGSLRFHQR